MMPATDGPSVRPPVAISASAVRDSELNIDYSELYIYLDIVHWYEIATLACQHVSASLFQYKSAILWRQFLD